jgi:hypothetical protein
VVNYLCTEEGRHELVRNVTGILEVGVITHCEYHDIYYISYTFLPLHYVTISGTINLIITQNLVMNSGKKPTGSSGQQQPPGCLEQGRQDAVTTKCTVARNVCGFSGR